MATPQDRYKNILVIVTGLLVLSKIFDQTALTTAALIVGVLAVLISSVAKAIEWLWFKMALGLGWVNSRILLSLVFFCVLLPMAWFSRWTRRDSLNLKRNHASSLFHTRNYRYRKEDLENIW
jgi:hypothetical protein